MKVLEDLAEVLNGKNGSVVPLLREAYRTTAISPVRSSCPFSLRLVGELYGLLTAGSNTCLMPEGDELRVRLLVTALIRELVTEVPAFVSPKFATYSTGSLPCMLKLIKELATNSPVSPELVSQNNSFLIDVFSNIDNPVPIRLEAIVMLLHSGGLASNSSLDVIVGDMLVVPVNIEEQRANFISQSKSGTFKKKSTSSLLRMVSSIATRRPLISPRSVRSNPTELDGTPSVYDDIFSVLVSAKNFNDQHLMHTGIMSILYPFLKQRLSNCEAPPNTPAVASAAATPTNGSAPSINETWGVQSRRYLIDSVVTLAVRILTQAQKDIASCIFDGKKSWKYVSSSTNEMPLVAWTREMVETSIVETLKCLDVVCKREVGVVSTVFPHVRKVYERTLQREDSPGIALTETLKFFISHSYLVIFDLEPVLRYYFQHHVAKRLLNPQTDQFQSSILAVETVVFLNQYAYQLCGSFSPIVSEHTVSLLRLAAWYPRTVGGELLEFFSQLNVECPVELFHGILDLPLMAAMNELTFSIDAYISKEGPVGDAVRSTSDPKPIEDDQFATARIAMRLIRSAEFKEISDYMRNGNSEWIESPKAVALFTEMWKGIPITPRVSAASKLVPQFLSVFFQNKSTSVLKAILSRYGSGKIFLFKPKEIGSVLIDFFTCAIADESLLNSLKNEIVSAIIERVMSPQSLSEDLVVCLVHRMSLLDQRESLPLFMRTLRWLLGRAELPEAKLDIVCIKNGRVVPKPSDRHVLLDKVSKQSVILSSELICVVIATLTRLAVKFPQYRPQTVSLFESVYDYLELTAQERISESLTVLNSFNLSRHLVGLGA